jgi:hypothetical protein
MPAFVEGLEPTLHSFYTVRFLVRASRRLRSADRLRRGNIHEPFMISGRGRSNP